MADAAPAKEGDAPAPKKPLPIGLILGGLNTVALFGLLGVLAYTKVLYKRPKMVEPVERERIVQEFSTKPENMHEATVTFDPMTANLKPTPIGVQVPGGPPQQMKGHTLSMAVSLVLSDTTFEPVVKGRQPKFLNQLLRELGTTSVDELSTVQGRFLLRSKIAGIMNDLVREEKHLPPTSTPAVTNVYFSEFVVQ